ncbi:MAG: glycoside hydrolase family 26 protein [Cytophagales bacterium]|jgi:mannan endo-1,4-beta-mannosidase|nr:glycoside hydrolase family 26 protein [Cytophagales bacterium]
MKAFCYSLAILLGLSLNCRPDEPPAEQNQPPVAKTKIVDYFKSLISRNEVLTGQQCGDGDDIRPYYDAYVEKLHTASGKYVGLIGADYGWKPNNFTTINNILIDYWKKGGLVTVSWHADNPWTDGYNVRFNSVTNKNIINLTALTKNAPASAARTNYRNELQQVAQALLTLKNAGVVVIWRPFHEMNGDWFWWGINEYGDKQTNTQDYVALWRDMHETFTQEYGLDNLIWVYSPAVKMDWNASVQAYYPGNAYVDLVGQDVYAAAPDIPDYTTLAALGKPVVLCEIGPDDKAYGKFDQLRLLEKAKGKAAYFLQWHSWGDAAKVAIIDNLNYKEMMNSPTAITRDKIEF